METPPESTNQEPSKGPIQELGGQNLGTVPIHETLPNTSDKKESPNKSQSSTINKPLVAVIQAPETASLFETTPLSKPTTSVSQAITSMAKKFVASFVTASKDSPQKTSISLATLSSAKEPIETAESGVSNVAKGTTPQIAISPLIDYRSGVLVYLCCCLTTSVYSLLYVLYFILVALNLCFCALPI